MRAKVSKTIALFCKLQYISPIQGLTTIYIAFFSPISNKETFFTRKPSMPHSINIQYNICLAIYGAITGSSRDKIYRELSLESLQHQRWYQKLCYFHKTCNVMRSHPIIFFN